MLRQGLLVARDGPLQVSSLGQGRPLAGQGLGDELEVGADGPAELDGGVAVGGGALRVPGLELRRGAVRQKGQVCRDQLRSASVGLDGLGKPLRLVVGVPFLLERRGLRLGGALLVGLGGGCCCRCCCCLGVGLALSSLASSSRSGSGGRGRGRSARGAGASLFCRRPAATAGSRRSFLVVCCCTSRSSAAAATAGHDADPQRHPERPLHPLVADVPVHRRRVPRALPDDLHEPGVVDERARRRLGDELCQERGPEEPGGVFVSASSTAALATRPGGVGEPGLERLVLGLELEPLFVGGDGVVGPAQLEEGEAEAAVALCPGRTELDALLGVGEGVFVLFERGLRGGFSVGGGGGKGVWFGREGNRKEGRGV